MDHNKSTFIKILIFFVAMFWLLYSTEFNFLTYVFVYLLVFGLPLFIIISAYSSYFLRKNQFHLFKLFLYFQPLSAERIQILKDHFLYYNKLSANDKILFEKYVNHFLINKKFTADDDIVVTEKKKVLIAATAIQILFGRDAFYLSRFSSIRLTNSDDMNFKKIRVNNELIIPWLAFTKGYDSLEDGYNPGIKIMALALSLEKQLDEASVFNFSSNTTFNKLYKSQAEKYIASGKSKYKSYNQVDRSEYFAVAVEYFFERPEHFHANQPEMYFALSKLLKQDPLGNYIYKRKK